MKKIFIMTAVAAMIVATGVIASAADPLGWNQASIALSATVGLTCAEDQAGTFAAMTIEPLSNDQTFSPSNDEIVKCTTGGSFTVTVSDANGGAGGVCKNKAGGGAALVLSDGTHNIPYMFSCESASLTNGVFTGDMTSGTSFGMQVFVAAADAAAATAGSGYADTVNLTITY